MKKLILIAGIFTASIISANTNPSIKSSEKKSKNKKEIVTKTKNKKEVRCLVFYATCTSAYTCQDWTNQQFIEWGNQIQDNYCQIGGEFAH